MAEEQIYDQIETGDPEDPLGLRKQLKNTKTTTNADPLGLRGQLKAAQQPAFQVQISQPTFKSAPAHIPVKTFTDATQDDLIIEKLQGKAMQAQAKLQEELRGNKPIKEKMIRQRRFEESTRDIPLSRSDMPKTQSALDVERVMPVETKPQYLPVTDEDIEQEDMAIQNDRGKAVRLLEETMKSAPDRAKEIQKNGYLIVAFNSLSATPERAKERVKKIESNAKLLEKGALEYDLRSNTLIKPLGLMGSAFEGWKQKNKLFADYDFLKNTENDAAIASELEDRRVNADPDEPMPVPKGKVSEIASMLGGTPIKPIVGGVVSSILTTPIGGATAGGVIGGREFAKLEYAANFQQVYNELRHEGVEKFEAVRQARRQAEHAAEIGAIMGGATGAIGARMGARPLALSNNFKKSAFNVLKPTNSELSKAAIEGLAAGGVGAAGQVYKNKLAQSIGINRDISEGVFEQIESNLLMTVAMAAAIKAGRGMAKGDYRNMLHGLSKMPDEQVGGMLAEKVNNGEITQKAADETVQRINEYKEKDSQIPGNITEEARFKIQDNIDKINELETQKEATHKSLQEPIKEKIQKLTEENLALSKETEKAEKPESGLTKAKEREATEIAEEWLSEGIFPDTFEGAIKADPIGFWRELAQQAQNRDKDWNPLKPEDAALSEQAVRDQFGDTVVDYAKELFPVSEIRKAEIEKRRLEELVKVSESGDDLENSLNRINRRIEIDAKYDNELLELQNDSPIAPIEQPSIKDESVTIKPKENAVSVEKPDAVDVLEQTTNGEALGQGDSQPKVAAGEEVGGQSQTQGNIEGQEGSVTPPTPPLDASGVYVERPGTQLSFRGLQDTANEFGFEDVKPRDRKSDLQTRVNAEKTANEWAKNGEYQKNIDEMLGKIERKEMVPTDEQRLILEQYLANEKQIARDIPKSSPEYDRQIDKVRRIKEIGNIARSEAAAALRIPDGGSRVHPVTDEVDAMAAKMEANNVDKLTERQKAEVEAQVEKYKKANDEANARVAELEEQVSAMDSEKEFKKAKSTTKRVKKTAEERAAYRRSEIEAAREALKKLRTGEGGLSAVPLPGVRELMAIAPHVKNIMVDFIAQGVDNLQDVVKSLHGEFKDVLEGIQEKDIHDIIAGVYNEKSKPLSELQLQIKDIQDEAKYINQLEALLAGKEPKIERAKRERNQKIKELKDKIKEFRKEEAGQSEFYKEDIDEDAKKLIAIKKRNQKREQEIRAKIAAGQFEKEAKKSIFDREDVKKNYPRLRKDALDAVARKEEAQHEFDLALYEDEMAQRSAIRKGADFLGKIVHTTKAVMSGIDDSATFVQNGLAMMANPRVGAKVWLEHWKDAFSPNRFKRELAALHADPDFETMQKSGLDIVEPHNAASEKVEEAFEKNLLAGKIKIDGKEFQPWKYTGGIFERAFTSMGNNMRVALFKKQMQVLKDAGKTFENHSQEYKDAARAINELTGRGKMPQGLAQASPYITPFIWAPRMLTSTVNVLGLSDLVLGVSGKGYYQNLTPAQRKFALSQLGRGVAMGVGVMGAAALGGAEVDYDPRSVTFGDVIMGDHHYNVFGRYTPVIKGIVQFAMGERVKKDGVQDLDSGKRGAKTRMGVIGGFFRGKMTPAAGVVYDLAEGKNYFTNEPFTIKDVPAALVTPMSVKELVEGWKNDGTWTILNRFLPAFEGLKVSDERDFKKSSDSKSKSTIHKSPRSKSKTNPHKNKIR